MTDGFVKYEPLANEIARICQLAAKPVRDFALVPPIALISHTKFGANASASAARMRAAAQRLAERNVAFEFKGEMQLNMAFDQPSRDQRLPCARLTDRPNTLVFRSIDAARATIDALVSLAEAESIGPILLGHEGRTVAAIVSDGRI